MNWLESFWKALSAPPAREMPTSVATLHNFTPRAQQVLSLACKEAERFNHHFIGTEHLLLGVIRLGQGTAVKVLDNMGVTLESVRLEVEKQFGTGPDEPAHGPIPYTPRVKKVLALAVKESKALNHSYVGTEHILLGLLREGDGVAGRVLKSLGVDTEVTRQHILRELDPNYSPAPDGLPGQWTRLGMSENLESEKSYREKVDISKRYDVYCREAAQQVVYRNVLFKGTKTLFQKREYDVFSEKIELEQADGKTILIVRSSVIKFCEYGITPNSEITSGGIE